MGPFDSSGLPVFTESNALEQFKKLREEMEPIKLDFCLRNKINECGRFCNWRQASRRDRCPQAHSQPLLLRNSIILHATFGGDVLPQRVKQLNIYLPLTSWQR